MPYDCMLTSKMQKATICIRPFQSRPVEAQSGIHSSSFWGAYQWNTTGTARASAAKPCTLCMQYRELLQFLQLRQSLARGAVICRSCPSALDPECFLPHSPTSLWLSGQLARPVQFMYKAVQVSQLD